MVQIWDKKLYINVQKGYLLLVWLENECVINECVYIPMIF